MDTARNGGTFAQGTATLGSPTEGVILKQGGWDWLDQVSQLADEAQPVINAVKGSKDTAPASAIQKPAPAPADNKILWIAGAVAAVIVLVLVLKK